MAFSSVAFFLLLTSVWQEPNPETQAVPVAPETTVTATRVATSEQEVPRSITVIDEQELQRRVQAVALDALKSEIGVWLEHRTGSSADPVIRGLSGGNILAMVDGSTLSTFWGEGGFAGDDMYGKVDSWGIERIEVVRGPASVLYGSNALGGVVNLITRRPPIDYTSGEFDWGGEFRSSYATNNSAWRERLDFWGATEKARFRVGGDLAAMGNFSNGDGRELTFTSGRESNADLNSEFLISDEETLIFNLQRVHRDPVYRHYRTTQSNSNDRLGILLELRSERASGIWDRSKVKLYMQDKEDWRFWDNGDRGKAHWRTYSLDSQAELAWSAHQTIYGLAFQLDRGESPDDEQFTMFPAGGGTAIKSAPDSDWFNVGVFVQDEWGMNDDWSLLSSLRYDYFLFDADPDPLYSAPAGTPAGLDDVHSSEGALTGGLALTRYLSDNFNVYLSWYRGFRQFAPNFGIRKHGWGVLFPNELLSPVESDTFEIGSKYSDHTLETSTALYYTDFNNFQNIVADSYAGSDYYDYDSSGTFEADERVYRTTANGNAFVRGIETAASLRLDRWWKNRSAEDWTVGGGMMWNFGTDRTNNVPLRHTHPLRGLANLSWEPLDNAYQPYAVLNAELVDAYTRIDPARLASDVGYLNDPQDSSSGLLNSMGLPGYTFFDLRCGFTSQGGIGWNFAVENLLDRQFRTAHSRVDAMGRNFVFSVTVPF
jgi:hemoglobin/transferrin/lactoferrin receptor protein